MYTYILPGAELHRNFLEAVSVADVVPEDLHRLGLELIDLAEQRRTFDEVVGPYLQMQPSEDDRTIITGAFISIIFRVDQWVSYLRQSLGTGGQLHFDRWLENGDFAVMYHPTL
jgi:hypothetical protein